MRRLLRRAFNFATAVSAVLFVATCVLWGRNDEFSDSVNFHWPKGLATTGTVAEGFAVAVRWSKVTIPYAGPRFKIGSIKREGMSDLKYSILNGGGTYREWGGFIVISYARNGGGVRAIVAPGWFMAAIFSLPIAAWLIDSRRNRKLLRLRLRVGLCPSCGYDLRGTPDRCPECGTVPTKIVCTT